MQDKFLNEELMHSNIHNQYSLWIQIQQLQYGLDQTDSWKRSHRQFSYLLLPVS